MGVQIIKEVNSLKHNIFKTAFSSVYPLYLAKVERKGRHKKELDAVIFWLTGYDEITMDKVLASDMDFEIFFNLAPQLNPNRFLIKGVICGIRVEEIEDPLMKEIRYLDKLVDELAKGKALEKVLRTP